MPWAKRFGTYRVSIPIATIPTQSQCNNSNNNTKHCWQHLRRVARNCRRRTRVRWGKNKQAKHIIVSDNRCCNSTLNDVRRANEKKTASRVMKPTPLAGNMIQPPWTRSQWWLHPHALRVTAPLDSLSRPPHRFHCFSENNACKCSICYGTNWNFIFNRNFEEFSGRSVLNWN